ncbi:MAG: ATP synthase subunit delta [Paracidovorax wautersii]|uniref:ATP synthase subunit delta n=1 Tax=Paracidovorax wautersii TaxID=1177982 RepID=A0A7V8FM41_9BURK|nr:MAG: ATP synthase subunit delta [Paracidovorax wautersii]
MAELATIARPYSEALFRAAQADLAATAAWLDELALIGQDARVLDYAADPRASQQQVLDLVASVYEASAQQGLPAQARAFLQAVLDNGRLKALPEIAAQFHALKSEQDGVAQAVVYSAFPIEGQALADLEAVLARKFARKLTVQEVIAAPELIGGVRAVVGDEVYDTSVKAQLENMKAALTA